MSESESPSTQRVGHDGAEQGAPLPRNVKVLGAVSFAQDTGSEMLYPLLPTFLTGVLGAPIVALGVAEGLADASAAGMKLLAGRFSQPGRRRRWIAAGYGLATVGKIIVALAFVWPVVLLGRTVDRLGKGIRDVPRDALIADVTTTGQRGRAFGFHRSLDTAGAVVGPLIGLGLLHLLDGRIRPALYVAIVPAVLSVVLVGLVREQRTGSTAPADDAPADDGSVDGAAVAVAAADAERRLSPQFWRTLAPLAVFAFVNSTDALLLQRASELGLSVTAVVVVYVLYNVVYAVLGYPAGKLSDSVSPRIVFSTGLVVFAAVYVGLGVADSASAVWVLLPCYGGYTALTDGVGRAWITTLVPAGQHSWALGIHGATTGVGALVAGLWAGLVWQGTGRLALTISGSVALIVALWLLTQPYVGRRRAM